MRLTIILLFISAIISAQEYTETILFDVSGITGDTIRSISYKPKDPGAIVELDFTSVNCDSLGLNIGYGTNDQYPVFMDTIPGVQVPITLDKTVYTNTFRGVESNIASIDITWYDANYIWIQIIDAITCTSGDVKLRMMRK